MLPILRRSPLRRQLRRPPSEHHQYGGRPPFPGHRPYAPLHNGTYPGHQTYVRSRKRTCPPVARMTTRQQFDIIKACADPNLFGLWFKDRDTWQAWFAFLAALFALEMTPEQLELFRRHTGRQDPPASPRQRSLAHCRPSRRQIFHDGFDCCILSQDSAITANLQQGERSTVAVIAADPEAGQSDYALCRALLTQIPMLARTVERETAEAIDLRDRVTIEVTTASHDHREDTHMRLSSQTKLPSGGRTRILQIQILQYLTLCVRDGDDPRITAYIMR